MTVLSLVSVGVIVFSVLMCVHTVSVRTFCEVLDVHYLYLLEQIHIMCCAYTVVTVLVAVLVIVLVCLCA